MLTNRLHGKAAELCLASSWNNSVSEYINHIHSVRYSFYHRVLVGFYCDIIARSRLHIINTLIDTFFIKLTAFLAEQRRSRKTNDG